MPRRKSTIKLSPKHGVNPSIIICPWCGKDKAVALLGRLKGDAEAPHEIITDYEPCDECQALWSQGVAVLEATPKDNGRPPISKDDKGADLYPTMRMVVLKKEAAENIGFPDKSPVLLEDKAFEHLFGEYCRDNSNNAGKEPDDNGE